ncbi:hypothetical protein JCM25156A_31340 [Komagataeibacter kakiaceti JCM 25156]
MEPVAEKSSPGTTGKYFRPRVLMLAESCNPEWYSVPLVGWSHYEAVARLADVHLVTRQRNRPALDRAGLKEGRDYTAIDTEFIFEPMVRLVNRISGPNKGWAVLTALTIPSYLLFEWFAWQRFRKALKGQQFDLVHRVTPVSPAVPSPFASWCQGSGVPFVLGPINGGLPWPPQFPDLQKQEGEWLSRFRFLFRFVPGYRSTRNAAAAIIAGGISAWREIPAKWRQKTFYIPENGFDPRRFPVAHMARDYANRPIHAIYIGRLVPYKGCDMLIEAAAPFLQAGRMTLTIIGIGPEEARLRAQISQFGIEGKVHFTGALSHHQIAEHLGQADILTFPSIREFGGAVVLEAMAMGVVPVIADYGGPAELASPNCAFLVPLAARPAFVHALREILGRIVAQPDQLEPLSRNGRTRANTFFTWSRKADQIMEIYRWVLGKRPTRPDWGMPFRDRPE